MRVSAPGKVLITGGYLVLEPSFSGAVIAASSRFHTSITVESLEGSDDDDPASASSTSVPVRVFSPQFHQSMHGELSATSFRFAYVVTRQAKVAKTGMGSSAALITSLVGALLGFFDAAQLPTKAGPHDTSTQADVTLVHNLAQIAHSIAQEKGMHMIMGDVNAGSATVSMVRKVLTWQSHDPVGAAALWADLNAQNMAIPALFEQLHALQAQDSALIKTTEQRSVSELLEELSRLPFHEVRPLRYVCVY
ncbi:hypothetical protein DYB30_011983 [Aphanomyces astaci]|uniref:phosphomevalonate kinase n=1 Tax=Aphanomyces astaci TaxID=112090 RepID=A0A397CQL5_APHAT|nr:hypothetical protein DYB30_011983 [Aphanomyces astaci]